MCVFCLYNEVTEELDFLACFLSWTLEGHPLVVWHEAWSTADFHKHLMNGHGIRSLEEKTSEVVKQVSGGRALHVLDECACIHLPKGQCGPKQTFHSGHTWEERTPAN